MLTDNIPAAIDSHLKLLVLLTEITRFKLPVIHQVAGDRPRLLFTLTALIQRLDLRPAINGPGVLFWPHVIVGVHAQRFGSV